MFPLAWSNPFFFVVEVSLGVSPRRFSWDSLGMSLEMSLEMSLRMSLEKSREVSLVLPLPLAWSNLYFSVVTT